MSHITAHIFQRLLRLSTIRPDKVEAISNAFFRRLLIEKRYSLKFKKDSIATSSPFVRSHWLILPLELDESSSLQYRWDSATFQPPIPLLASTSY